MMRALMLDPPILLLDEPMGALDPVVRYDLQEDLKQIFQQLKKTVVLVTHDMGEAGFFGEDVMLMNGGRIVQRGKLVDFMENPAEEFVTRFITAQRPLVGSCAT
jgi:osmoprotectant transport system ATP-binding protein